MPWRMGQRERAYITCSVIDYDSLNCRQRKHHAIGQIKSALADIFLLSIAAGGVGFKEHWAEARCEYWLQSQ